MKHTTIIENNHISGVVYGEIDIPDTETNTKIKATYKQIEQKRAQIQAQAYKRTQHK